jgi:RNA-binding protein 25
MKEFLEDYDDERDDPKYYKGKAYKSRMAARLEEADADMEDRQLEMKELEKLKAEIFNGKYENPAQEFERQRQALENKYKPKIVLDKNHDHNNDERRGSNKDKTNHDDSDSSGGRFSPDNHHRRSNSRERMDVDELSRNSLLSNSTTPNSPTANQNSSSGSGGGGGAGGIGMGFSLSLNKRRKIDPKSAFNMDDENEDANGPAKKKLVPLGKSITRNKTFKSNIYLNFIILSDYEENLAKQKAKRDADSKQANAAEYARSQDEKRKLHKQIIDKIPIDKEDLFNHPLDLQEIDGTIKKKLQSWINKKMIEYIGEPEQSLVEFICSKLLAGSSPQSILDDIRMVILYSIIHSLELKILILTFNFLNLDS